MEKTKAISKKKQKRELVFAGAASLMGVDTKKLGPADVAAHKARTLVARALGIPPNTVVMMGGNVYVDNHGRKHKMQDYAKSAQFEYDYVQIATDDNMKAIVKCRIVEQYTETREDQPPKTYTAFVSRPLCGWVIGECSPTTTRMSTLKGYQNHLAQTRAENRAFEAAFGVKFRKDLYEGIGRELGVKPEESMDQEASLALQAGNTSAEEAVDMKKASQPPLGFNPFANASLAIKNATDVKSLEGLKARVKASKNFTPKQSNELINQIEKRIVGIATGQ